MITRVELIQTFSYQKKKINKLCRGYVLDANWINYMYDVSIILIKTLSLTRKKMKICFIFVVVPSH